VCSGAKEVSVEERLTVTVEKAAKLLGIGRTLAYELIQRGELPAKRLGTRLVVPRAAIDRFLETE
jgi:excisionase family DNA binding protein